MKLPLKWRTIATKSKQQQHVNQVAPLHQQTTLSEEADG